MFGAASNGTASTSGVKALYSSLTLASGDFTVKVGANGTAVDLAGTYKDGQALADNINTLVGGAFASYDTTSHKLNIASNSDFTLGGTKYGTGAGNLGFAAANATVAADTKSLNDANVKDVTSANDAILRVDGALTAVSTCAARWAPSRTASSPPSTACSLCPRTSRLRAAASWIRTSRRKRRT